MDLRQIARAVAAHKLVATLGVIAAIGFAFLAHVRVDPFGSPALAYRKPNLWGSTVTLQLTQQGFPEGRVLEKDNRREALVQLAPLYARLANTDQVKKRMRKNGPIPGKVVVQPVVDENRSSLPLVQISSFAYTASSARERAKRQADAFRAYIAQQQELNHVRPTNRVILKVVSGPTAPAVVVPRKITLPVIVFLSMLIVTGGLILTLENLGTGAGARKPKPEEPGSETRAPLEALKSPPEEEALPPRSARPEPVVANNQAAGSTVARPGPMRTLRSDGGPENGKSRRTEESGSPDVQQSRAADVQDVASQARWARRSPRG